MVIDVGIAANCDFFLAEPSSGLGDCGIVLARGRYDEVPRPRPSELLS